MRPLSLASLALPLALTACAAGPGVKAKLTADRALPALAVAPVPAASALPVDPETELLARLDAIDNELDPAHRRLGPRRLQITPASFQLGELPVGHVEPPLAGREQPPMAAWRKRQSASELAVQTVTFDGYQRSVIVSFTEPTVGYVVVGDYQLRNINVARSTNTSSYVSCGPGAYPRYQPARWTKVRRVDDGKLEYVVTDGWVESVPCKIWVERQTTITLAPLLPGDLLYGFVDCKEAEADKASCALSAELTLIFPPSPIVVGSGIGGEVTGQNNGFGVASIPFRRGGGASLFVRLDTVGMRAFRDSKGRALLPREVEDAADGPGLGLGVEVAQGVDDPEPIAIAYMARPPVPPSPPVSLPAGR